MMNVKIVALSDRIALLTCPGLVKMVTKLKVMIMIEDVTVEK